VNLQGKEKFVIDPEKDEEKFVPLKKDSRVKIRPLEEVEKERKETKAKEEAQKKEAEFSPGVSVVNYDEVMQQKTDEAEQTANRIVEDARKQAQEIIAQANEEADSVREQAREEGLETGKQEALVQVEAEADQIRVELEADAKRLQKEYEELLNQIEPRYVDVLCSLIQKLTGILFTENKDLLLHLIRSSIADMEPSKRYTIRVSPDDMMAVESCRSELAKEAGNVIIEIQEEKGLAKNECIIEADSQMVDCGFKTQLDNLITTLRMLVQER
jgi:flagellar assembly protein FliH